MLITDRYTMHGIPYVHQFGEARLGSDGGPQPIPVTDPRWRELGASTYDEYLLWARNGCGTACFRMVLLHQYGVAPSLVQLAKWLMNAGAYEVRSEGIYGMIYQPFVEYVQAALGFGGRVVPSMSLTRMTYELSMRHYVFASVHPSIRNLHNLPPKRGGHLVLVTGFSDAEQEFTIHDPSGVLPDRQESARVPYDDFRRFFANRGLVIWNPEFRRSAGPQPEFWAKLRTAFTLPTPTYQARSVLSTLTDATAQELHDLRVQSGWGQDRVALAQLRMELAKTGSDFDECLGEATQRPVSRVSSIGHGGPARPFEPQR